MQIESLRRYLSSSIKTPFFLFIGDEDYAPAINELSLLGLNSINMSEFCSSNDKLPDIDGLLNYIKTIDVNAKDKRFVVKGIGEYLAHLGSDESASVLLQLKDLNIGGAKVVLLLRGLVSQASRLQSDLRFDDRRFYVMDKAECDLSFIVAAPSVDLSALPGFKAMLAELENGRSGNIVVNTAINLDKSLFTIHKINTAYEGIKFTTTGFTLLRSCGSDHHWAELLKELNQSNGSLDEVFERQGLSNNLESNFYARIAGNDYYSWLYFICLKYKADSLTNDYLRFVLDNTNRFEDFASNVLNAIIDISHTDKRFPAFYKERKNLIEKFPESDIAEFVVKNREVVNDSVYKLTDGTKIERQEIIAWISRNGMIAQIESIYPILAAYLKKYVFKNSTLADLLTEYFEDYKRQKLSNILETEFLVNVDKLAQSPRVFNRLPTRNEILDGLDKADTYLYWLDALGVEYLALIESLAKERGLSISIRIARAELPTTTSFNNDFYKVWQGRKEKNGDLDDVKHGDRGGYNFTNNDLPIHLAEELDIIKTMMYKAATELGLRNYKRFLIVSDHGASRLAVLRRKEEKYETDTRGEHSGRFCKLFHPYDLPFAVEENGYLVLADYGRFKGSRAANVEVHGGASLEEVIVPIIELTLKDGSVAVKLVEEVVIVDPSTGAEITLFFNSPVKDVTVVLNGKSYDATQSDANHYVVKLPHIKRAGEHTGDIYVGDNLVGKINIKAQGKSARINDAFDELF